MCIYEKGIANRSRIVASRAWVSKVLEGGEVLREFARAGYTLVDGIPLVLLGIPGTLARMFRRTILGIPQHRKLLL